MGNGMDKILPGLYLGNFRDSKDGEQLTKNKITHVVAIHDNAQPLFDHLQYKCVQIGDSPDQNITAYFRECIYFIHKCRIEGGACLVHCIAGVSRSTTIVAAYIMSVTSLGWIEALSAIKVSRAMANPNCGFQRQLEDFSNIDVYKERERLRTLFPNTSFDDENYLMNLMSKEGKGSEGDFDDTVPSTLNQYRNRTDFPNGMEYDTKRENNDPSAENTEETTRQNET